MLKFLKNEKSRLLFFDIVFIIIGFLFCILPETSMSTLEALTSGLLVIYGLYLLIIYLFTNNKNKEQFYLGLFYFILGVFVTIIATLFAIALGIILIIQGLKLIVYSAEIRLNLNKDWWVDFAIGVALFIFGVSIIILCNTSVGTKIISIVLGIFLILYGGSDLMLNFGFKRNYSELKKHIIFKNFKESTGNNSNSSNNSTNPSSNNTNYDDFTDYDIK